MPSNNVESTLMIAMHAQYTTFFHQPLDFFLGIVNAYFAIPSSLCSGIASACSMADACGFKFASFNRYNDNKKQPQQQQMIRYNFLIDALRCAQCLYERATVLQCYVCSRHLNHSCFQFQN